MKKYFKFFTLLITFYLKNEAAHAFNSTYEDTGNFLNAFMISSLLLFILLLLLFYRHLRLRKKIRIQNHELKKNQSITESAFENIHSYILLVDKNFIVKRTNYYSLTGDTKQQKNKTVGELLHCKNAIECGCGKSVQCPHCNIRNAIGNSFKKQKDFNSLKASLDIIMSNKNTVSCEAIISGSYLKFGEEEYVLISVFDVTKERQIREKAQRDKAQFFLTINSLPVGIGICDKEGYIDIVNNFYHETMGTTPEYLLKNKVNFFKNPCIPNELKSRMKKGEKISEEVKYDYKLLNKEGYFISKHSNVQYYRIITDYIKDLQGNIESYIIIWVNNTLIHNTLKENRNIQNMFRFASSASKTGFTLINFLKDETIVTPEYLTNLGENINTDVKDIIKNYRRVHPEDRKKLLDFTEKAFISHIPEETFDMDIRVMDANGNWRWVRQMLKQKTFENGNVEILGWNIDSTDRKNVEEELKRSKIKAQNSDKLKSIFLANMSHEIRTPLNAIVGFSRLLAESDDPDEKKSYADIIDNNNELLLQLINDILDLSKIEADTLEFVYSVVNINSLLYDIEQSTKMKAGENSPVEIIFEPGLPECNIYTERNRLSQIITNFLTNALKFTYEGAIRFGYKQQENGLYFYVTDTGSGISKEDQTLLFQRFTKLNKIKPGTGLGLAISKTIVEKLGGEIGVSSEEGKGSTFWFTLPTEIIGISHEKNSSEIQHTDNKQNIEDEEIIIDSEISAKTISTGETKKKTVLIAEDMEDNYKLYEVSLGKKYKLIHAWDGQEAVELFEKNNPDIILMDIKMPVMDGYKATESIRKISNTVPIIGVTAFAFAEDKERILSSGFDQYLTKPIVPKKLIDLLESMGI